MTDTGPIQERPPPTREEIARKYAWEEGDLEIYRDGKLMVFDEVTQELVDAPEQP